MGFIQSPSASETGHTYIPVTKSKEWKKERGKEGNVTVEVGGGGGGEVGLYSQPSPPILLQ